MKLPAGFRFAATYAGIRKIAKNDVASDRVRSPGRRGRGVHPESAWLPRPSKLRGAI